MRYVLLPAALVAIFAGCSRENEPRSPSKDGWELEPMTERADGAYAASTSTPYRRETIVLGRSEDGTYDATSGERKESGAPPQGGITVIQQQTVHSYGGPATYGYGYAYPYGYGTTIRPETSLRTTPAARLTPGADWPRPADPGPRMLGDRSR